MKHTHYPGIPDNLPCISIIIPFEPRMNTTKGLNCMLSAAAEKEEIEIMKNYPEGEGISLIKKLHTLMKNMKFKTGNKSIAILVSSLSEKVYYFNYSEKKLSNYMCSYLRKADGD